MLSAERHSASWHSPQHFSLSTPSGPGRNRTGIARVQVSHLPVGPRARPTDVNARRRNRTCDPTVAWSCDTTSPAGRPSLPVIQHSSFCILHSAFTTTARCWNRTSDSSLEETHDATSPTGRFIVSSTRPSALATRHSSCPRQDLNLDFELRRLAWYPFHHGDCVRFAPPARTFHPTGGRSASAGVKNT